MDLLTIEFKHCHKSSVGVVSEADLLTGLQKDMNTDLVFCPNIVFTLQCNECHCNPSIHNKGISGSKHNKQQVYMLALPLLVNTSADNDELLIYLVQ